MWGGVGGVVRGEGKGKGGGGCGDVGEGVGNRIGYCCIVR